jgi:ferredoxin
MSTSVPSFTIVIEPAGWTFTASADVPLVQAARDAGFVLPSSCRNGTCRTCLCPLKSGETAYTIEWPGVSVDEKEEGLILPCVSVARSDLVIESPRAILVSQLVRSSQFARERK